MLLRLGDVSWDIWILQEKPLRISSHYTVQQSQVLFIVLALKDQFDQHL